MSLGALLFRTTQRLRGSTAAARLATIARAPFQSPAAVEAAQLAALRALVEHAATHVPYYRRRFAEAGISAAGFRSLADLSRLPILTKADIRDHGPDLVDERLDRATLLAHHSGGSTGVPLTFYRTTADLDASDAGLWRNLTQAGWRPGDMIAHVWGWNERLNRMPRWEFEARQWLRRSYQFDPFQAGEAAFPGWARTWNRIRPAVAMGYASTLARFAEWVLRSGTRIVPVRGSFTTAETLYPPQREAIARAFGGRVYDLYGSSEVQNIAAECPAGRMHVNADYAVVETDGPAGARAPLLVTSLVARAMPFIRYRNEDQGRLLSEGCPCGRGFPVMALEIARQSDNFSLPGGRVVHGEFFTHLMYGADGVETFQFHQVAPDRIVLRLVGPPGVEHGAAALRARTEVEGLAPGRVRLEVERVESIALSRAGKHRFTRSDVTSAPGDA